MEKFEYKFEKIAPLWSYNKAKQEKEVIDKLNELGQQGWELVDSGDTFPAGAIFKRKIKD